MIKLIKENFHEIIHSVLIKIYHLYVNSGNTIETLKDKNLFIEVEKSNIHAMKFFQNH